MTKYRIIKRAYYDGTVKYIPQKKSFIWGWNNMRKWDEESKHKFCIAFSTLDDAKNYINDYKDEIIELS